MQRTSKPAPPTHLPLLQVVSGQALQSLCKANRGDGGGCLSLTAWILIFSASQLLLCLLPDINSLTAVTAMGAATTLGFSVLATVGSAVQGGWVGGCWAGRQAGVSTHYCGPPLPAQYVHCGCVLGLPWCRACDQGMLPAYCLRCAAGRAPDVSYAVQGSPADRVFGAFTSLGAIYLLFGLTVLLEIQVGWLQPAWLGDDWWSGRLHTPLSVCIRSAAACRRGSRLPLWLNRSLCPVRPLQQSTLAPAPTSAVPPMVRVGNWAAMWCH